MNNAVIKLALLFLLPLGFVKGQEIPNTLTPEQKAYELSLVWKEMSYNFDKLTSPTATKPQSRRNCIVGLLRK